MFFKKHPFTHMENLAPSLQAPSIISESLHIQGHLNSDGEVHIDGHIKGEVHCKVLTIGLNGHVKGNVHAETIRIRGAVEGNVTAHSVFLGSTARVIGDIHHETLSMEPGAFVKGTSYQGDLETASPRSGTGKSGKKG